jgi:hypothetical protein
VPAKHRTPNCKGLKDDKSNHIKHNDHDNDTRCSVMIHNLELNEFATHCLPTAS